MAKDLAPHVTRAIKTRAPAATAVVPRSAKPGQAPAAHVAAALASGKRAAAQAKAAEPLPAGRVVAPHVQAAISPQGARAAGGRGVLRASPMATLQARLAGLMPAPPPPVRASHPAADRRSSRGSVTTPWRHRPTGVVQRSQIGVKEEAELLAKQPIDPACSVIWKWLKEKASTKAYIEKNGIEMYYVFVGHSESQCHHFAFGNLVGANQDYNIEDLFKVLRDYNEALLNAASISESQYNRMVAKAPDSLWDGNEVWQHPKKDVRKKYQAEQQTVCIMGTGLPTSDHSARQEMKGGLWWHKFVGLSYVLGFKEPNPEMFGYKRKQIIEVMAGKGGYDAAAKRWIKPNE